MSLYKPNSLCLSPLLGESWKDGEPCVEVPGLSKGHDVLRSKPCGRRREAQREARRSGGLEGFNNFLVIYKLIVFINCIYKLILILNDLLTYWLIVTYNEFSAPSLQKLRVVLQRPLLGKVGLLPKGELLLPCACQAHAKPCASRAVLWFRRVSLRRQALLSLASQLEALNRDWMK